MLTAALSDTETAAPCGAPCRACIKAFNLTEGELFGVALPLSATRMILCPTCGNKRCPHASDHLLACTGSNDPGQPGSVYE